MSGRLEDHWQVERAARSRQKSRKSRPGSYGMSGCPAATECLSSQGMVKNSLVIAAGSDLIIHYAFISIPRI